MRCSLASGGGGAKAVRAPLRYVKSASVSALGGSDSGYATPRRLAADERFGLLVDGEYYGPFAHAQIAPCVMPGSSETISLPVMSFFPIDDDGTGI